MPAPRRFDHELAFLFWHQGPQPGERKSYQQVADRFGVAAKSVEETASREDWRGRAEEIDRETRKQTNRRLAKTAANRNADFLLMIDHMAGLGFRRLALPADDPDALRPGDFGVRELVELARLAQLLQGQATERHGAESEGLDTVMRELADAYAALGDAVPAQDGQNTAGAGEASPEPGSGPGGPEGGQDDG